MASDENVVKTEEGCVDEPLAEKSDIIESVPKDQCHNFPEASSWCAEEYFCRVTEINSIAKLIYLLHTPIKHNVLIQIN